MAIELVEGDYLIFDFGYFKGEEIRFDWTAQTIAGTAGPADFVPVSTTGQQVGGVTTFIAATKVDDLVEGPETFTLTISGTYSDQNLPYSYAYDFVIVDPEPLSCVADLDGDGGADPVELTLAEAQAQFARLASQHEAQQFMTQSLEDRIVALGDEAEAIQAQAYLSLLRYAGSLASGGVSNSASRILTLTSLTVTAIGQVFQGEDPQDAAQDAWFQALDFINNELETPSKWLPIISMFRDAQEAFDAGLELNRDMIAVVNNLSSARAALAESQAREAQLAQAMASFDCVSPDGVVLPLTAQAADANRLSAVLAAADSITATHFDFLPEGLYVAGGTAAAEVLSALESAGEDNPRYLIAPGQGDDLVLVSSGTVFVQDTGGFDLVRVLGTDGALASAADILEVQALAFTSGDAGYIAVGNRLFLATQGIEAIVFAEGEFRLENGVFTFVPGETRETVALTERSDRRDYTDATAGLVIDAFGGNDHVSGTRFADLIRAGDGNDHVDASAGGDRIEGQGGNDRLTLGAGADVVVFAEGGDHDYVEEFTRGADRIELDLAVNGDHIDSFVELQALISAGEIRLSANKHSVVLQFDDGDKLTIDGISNLAEQDWIFA